MLPDDDEMDVDNGRSSPAARAQDIEAHERELDDLYPNRPRNHSPTFPFHTIFEEICNPLKAEEAKKTGPLALRRQTGPHSGPTKSEKKGAIFERYFSRWRREVGNDFYPLLRLMLPEKDRDRAMYGLKEKVLGRYIVKILQIDRNSEDAYNLINWKNPGSTAHSTSGDFSARCFEIVSKRPFRVDVGNLTIGEVNDMLDELAASGKEEDQLPIISKFYQKMNPEEFMWLVRIILRQIKIGSTEKTVFRHWHQDAYSLFSISSSLRRVCWELWSPNIRLEGEDRGVKLMQCFQPQLAQGKKEYNNAIVVRKMRLTEDDNEFWIEEKLDGERMQMHMVRDDNMPGGRRFRFWSRKAKEYTYLYGDGTENKESALTQHLKDAFHDGVENIILDGEMITWDPEIDRICAFGTLKTAALAEGQNPYAGTARPMFRIFDILLLNDTRLTPYTLRKRREALEKAVKPVHRRFEIHPHTIGTSEDDIENALNKVIEEGSEGLVIKSPRTSYAMNERIDDWIKVKPEYLKEGGQTFDCLVIGGYWGAGKRGGRHSSYLCGLRTDKQSDRHTNPQKFISFFKVGGGMGQNDYDRIRYETEDKWMDFDAKKPPIEWIELAGGSKLIEKPDQWIKPEDSVAFEVKCAQMLESDEFAAGYTLRFVRFKRLRLDKNWETVLSVSEFLDLKDQIEKDVEEKKSKTEKDKAEERHRKSRKKELRVVGYSPSNIIQVDATAQKGQVFQGQTFFIITDSTSPVKKSKQQLEEMVKQYGGKIVQTHRLPGAAVSSPPRDNDGDNELLPEVLCIAESNKPRVASLRKRGDILLVKPVWLFDCISQAAISFAQGMPEIPLLLEPDRHVYFIPEDLAHKIEGNVDPYGDSYSRDTTVDELRLRLGSMTDYERPSQEEMAKAERLLEESQEGEKEMTGWIFCGVSLYFDMPSEMVLNGDESSSSTNVHSKAEVEMQQARTTAMFAGATIVPSLDHVQITHIVVSSQSNVAEVRKQVATLHKQGRSKIPRVVTLDWIKESWKEGTLLDSERFAP